MSKGSKRRSAEEWRGLVHSWRRSGQSRERFALERGLMATTLGWWASELARRERVESDGAETASRAAPASFFPVRVVGDEPAARPVDFAAGARVELVLGGGRKLRVPVGVDAVWVARMVTALEESGSC